MLETFLFLAAVSGAAVALLALAMPETRPVRRRAARTAAVPA
jgi:hypothetical protein